MLVKAKEIYNLGIIEIYSEDLSIEKNSNPNIPIQYRNRNKLTFDEANNIAEEMGNGWRLPTMKEILFLQEYDDLKILEFDSDAYWVSSGLEEDESMGEYLAWAYYFSMKRRGGIPKTERIKARLVRSI